MEMQACVNHYVFTANDSTMVNYSKGNTLSQTGPPKNSDAKMRVLFSGYGKAEQDLGITPIPALHPFEIQFPNN